MGTAARVSARPVTAVDGPELVAVCPGDVPEPGGQSVTLDTRVAWVPGGQVGDGGQVAFGVPRTSPVNPETSAAGSEVWVVTLADRGITVMPDLLATDLEWSPDGSLLAIASREDALVPGEGLQDGRIHLFATRLVLPAFQAASDGSGQYLFPSSMTWSPDDEYLLYQAWGKSEGDPSGTRPNTTLVPMLRTDHQMLWGAGTAYRNRGGRPAESD